jgi:predicted Holliday junction resolvase-like endonuclease
VRVDVLALVERLEARTRAVFAEARGAERHVRLCQRLARLLEQAALARWIETHIDAVRRDIEAD